MAFIKGFICELTDKQPEIRRLSGLDQLVVNEYFNILRRYPEFAGLEPYTCKMFQWVLQTRWKML